VSKGEKSEIKKIPFDMDKKDMDKKKPSLVGYWKKLVIFSVGEKIHKKNFSNNKNFCATAIFKSLYGTGPHQKSLFDEMS